MIGVNFGGYHAEAGLGGLLTGNAAHGGLIASAGTPSGQSAVAGLGGNTGRKFNLNLEFFYQKFWTQHTVVSISVLCIYAFYLFIHGKNIYVFIL